MFTRRTVAFAALLSVSALANAAPFTAGNVVVERVGSGASALSSAATSVFLDEFNATGALQQSLSMTVTASGTATSEGLLNRTADAGAVDPNDLTGRARHRGTRGRRRLLGHT